MSKKRVYEFDQFSDSRSELIVIEGNASIPFEIKRIYYIYDAAENAKRGFHAHRISQQVAICLRGSCKLLLDNGREREEFLLASPNEGIHIAGMQWREITEFSNDCILLFLASSHYDENDYVYDYEEFKQMTSA